MFGCCIWAGMPLVPVIMDLTFPINETRPKMDPYYGDFLIIEQKDYFYWTVAQTVVLYFTTVTMFVGVDGIFVLAVKHTCGLYSIVWYA